MRRPKVVVAVRLEAVVADRLSDTARARGISTSDFIRAAIERDVGAPSSSVTKAADEAAGHLADLTQTLARATRDTAAVVGRLDGLRAAANQEPAK